MHLKTLWSFLSLRILEEWSSCRGLDRLGVSALSYGTGSCSHQAKPRFLLTKIGGNSVFSSQKAREGLETLNTTYIPTVRKQIGFFTRKHGNNVDFLYENSIESFFHCSSSWIFILTQMPCKKLA